MAFTRVFQNVWGVPNRRWKDNTIKSNVSLINTCCTALRCSWCLTLCDPVDCSLPGSSVHGDSPGKNTGVGCHALLQGIFPTQESNPGLLHCRQILYQLSYAGSLNYLLGIIIFVLHPLLVIGCSNKLCENIIYTPSGNLLDPGIKPRSPAFTGSFFTISATWEAHMPISF